MFAKIVTLSAISRLVIASKEVYLVWKCNFHSKKQRDNFNLMVSSVNIVAHEDQFLPRLTKLYLAQDLDQIIVLSMYVTNYDDFAFDTN